MLLFRHWLQRFNQVRRQLHLDSLQVNLTVAIATFTAVGLGGAAVWTSWKMEQILVQTHKQNVQYIANRFPKDVSHYSEEKPALQGVQPAINSLTADNVLIWLESPQGQVIAQSAVLKNRTDQLNETLQSLPKNLFAQVYAFDGRYLVMCSRSLEVKGTQLGTLFVAQDITNDQTLLIAIMRNLAIATILAIIGITVAVSIYIQRSLSPLRQMSQLAEDVSPQTLTQARLQLQNAPREVRELAQSCNDILENLSQTWEQQRQLVSNVSHELRTPLTIVQGYIQSLLRRADNLTEAQREALMVADSEAKRTIQLLQDLLDLARAESGVIHIQFELFILYDLLSEVVEMSKQVSHRKIVLEISFQPLEINNDRARLKQVLINLIDNAIKYSPESEPVTVAMIPQSNSVSIEVRDRGFGIPLTQQTRIFERFYRVDEARTRSGGSGLGLAIVKTLIEQMGGRITLRSQPDHGSVFIVTLPQNLE